MSAIKMLTQFDFYPTIEQTDGLSLVYFSAQSCASCHHLTKILTQLTELKTDLSVFKVDAQQDQALVREYEVFHLPSMFLFNAGQFHAALNAQANPSSILHRITEVLKQPAQEAP